MKNKGIVWLLSLLLSSEELFGDFCRQNGFQIRTTGDFQFFDDIKENCESIRVLVIDADQFKLAEIPSIMAQVSIFTKPGLFEGKVVFVSAKKKRLAALKRRHYRHARPTPRAIKSILSRLIGETD